MPEYSIILVVECAAIKEVNGHIHVCRITSPTHFFTRHEKPEDFIFASFNHVSSMSKTLIRGKSVISNQYMFVNYSDYSIHLKSWSEVIYLSHSQFYFHFYSQGRALDSRLMHPPNQSLRYIHPPFNMNRLVVSFARGHPKNHPYMYWGSVVVHPPLQDPFAARTPPRHSCCPVRLHLHLTPFFSSSCSVAHLVSNR